MAGPHMNNEMLLRMAGINPKTGLPERSGSDPSAIAKDMSNSLSLIDKQQAIGSFKWDQTYDMLESELIERMLYYKYTLMLFRFQDRHFLLPYALSGNIDVYGNFLEVTPLPFGGPSATTDTGEKKQKPWIEGLVRTPVRSLEECTDPDTQCVLLYDYSRNYSQLATPRADLNKVYINMEAEMPAMMRTALLNGAGVSGVRINSEDVSEQIIEASNAVNLAALSGQRFVPVVDSIEAQELGTGSVKTAEEYMLGMRSIDNLRLTSLGIDNGGMFEKQGTMLKDEHSSGTSATAIILNDRLYQRQHFNELANKLFGGNQTVEIAEPETIQVEGQESEGESGVGSAMPNDAVEKMGGAE